MGARIDHVECLSGELTISEEGKTWTDESCTVPECPPVFGTNNKVKMRWSGEGSSYSFGDGTLEKFFSFTRGTAEFLFYWEGMGVEGIRVVNGKMTKHEVEMKLGKEVK
jgi:hypothetical protein